MESTFQRRPPVGAEPALEEPVSAANAAVPTLRSFGVDEELFPPSPEQRRQRIILLLEQMAPLVAQLSEELCKEDHGAYMRLATKVEEAAIVVDANLAELETLVNEGESLPEPGDLMRFLALFNRRAKENVEAFERLKRRRARQLETVSKLRQQLQGLRVRPAAIHEAAVDHVKRLMLYEDPRFEELQRRLQHGLQRLEVAERRGRYSRDAVEIRNVVDPLKETLAILDREFRDRALQSIQESDNGSRPK